MPPIGTRRFSMTAMTEDFGCGEESYSCGRRQAGMEQLEE